MLATKHFTTQSLGFLFIFFILFAKPAFTDAQPIVKVKTQEKGGKVFSGVNQHGTWDNATYELQQAIDHLHANGGGEVWVAGGTYFPTSLLAAAPDAPNPPLTDPEDPASPADGRQLSFIMASGVLVIGGFDGSESSKDDRPSDLFDTENKVILSGDIGVPALNEDNVYHVVIFPPETDDSAILQNVEVTGGYADGPADYFAKTGAGVHIREGGLLKECQVYDNTSAGSGGGVYLYKGGKVESCIVFENNAFVQGGGIYSNLGGEISKTAIYSNTAGNIENDGKGGGVLFVANDDAEEGSISHSAIFANQSTNKGGGIANYLGGQIINNYIGNNEAAGKGGGVFLQAGGQMLNNTVVSNAGDQGAALYCSDGGTVYNTVMWGNTTPYSSNQQVAFDDNAATTYALLFDFCAIQNGTVSPEITNMISLDPENSGNGLHPQFNRPVSFSGIPTSATELEEIKNSNYAIGLSSALLDAGKPDLTGLPVPESDLLDAPRITKSIIDIGAVEALYYNVSGTVSGGNGTISPNTSVKVMEGGEVEFVATPDVGYTVAEFLINNTDYTMQITDQGEWYTYTQSEISQDLLASVDFSIPNTLSHINAPDFLMYPNPAREVLFFEGISAKCIKIINSCGQIITAPKRPLKNAIDISALQSGIYFLVIQQDNNQEVVKKFFKD